MRRAPLSLHSAPFVLRRGIIRRQQAGFALVVTIALLVLLVLIAVGLLSLGTISLRGGDRQALSAQARANARLALMIAIGELQKQTGPDTRITAPANLEDEEAPPVLGVWKSWEGSDHDGQGRPISPGNYHSEKEKRFLGWLASGDSQKLPATTASDKSVTLVGESSVGATKGRDKQEIHLEPQIIKSPADHGAYAWWVGGENLKARIPAPYEPENDGPAGWSDLVKSHSVADPEIFRMDDLLDDASPVEKTTSLRQGDFLAGKPVDLRSSQEFFHDLSATAVGLLTNSATGGWRKDLSLATERWGDLPNAKLPFFRLKPEKDIFFARPSETNATPEKSMMYPWSAYRGGNDEVPIYKQGAISSWENLKDWATAYQRVSSGAGGSSSIPWHTVGIWNTGKSFGYIHQVRIMPVVARFQWVLSHSAVAVAARPGYYEPRLLLTPVVTMWNPYSVQISAPAMSFNVPKPLPVALRYTVRGVQRPSYQALTSGSLNNLPAMSSAGGLTYSIANGFSLNPGESRIFSPPAKMLKAVIENLPLQAGYRNSGGTYIPLTDETTGGILQIPNSEIKVQAKFDTSYRDINDGVGIYFDASVNGEINLAYRMIYPPTVANQIYPPLNGLAGAGLNTAALAPVPFMSVVFGTRMASKTHLPSKGFVQSSPLVFYTAMGTKDLAERTISRHYGGTGHPVNSPFDFSFLKHSGMDSYLPNADDTSGRGYIVTGFNKSDGLSRCVVAEIPTRPLLSLGELQGWDARFENPIPPYAFNLVANSDATPLLPPDAVVNAADRGLPQNLQHDDSYCLNHLLFDDWFFSSIAPAPGNFGASGGSSLEDTFKRFVQGKRRLGNRAYRPLPEDLVQVTSNPDAEKDLLQSAVRKADSYRSIASRLEVEGMFNVNSTSVTAWRALLRHARNQRIPFIDESGGGWSVKLSGETDHAASRFMVAGDTEAGNPGSSGAFPGATEFSGYRVLDEEFIDKLAEEIVGQVRARGPFLSLSEFVNRQLSSGDLAMAGAIQAAINKLAESSSTNPFKEIQAMVGMNGRSSGTPALAGDTEYQFPAAADGWNAYGLPGWTRQADILRPLAPILSVRDDTFTIRAYGDARSENGEVLSRATCEAVVRRRAGYVDPADTADTPGELNSEVNRRFGRRIEIVGFRWLNPSEI